MQSREKWIFAMQGEMQTLEKNGTCDVVCLPKQKKVIRSRFEVLIITMYFLCLSSIVLFGHSLVLWLCMILSLRS
jgi:hypothetical protein